MTFSSFPFVRIVLVLISGILMARYFPHWTWAMEVFLIGVFLYTFQVLVLRKKGVLVGLTALFTIGSAGYYVMKEKQPDSIPTHALHSFEEWEYFKIRLSDTEQNNGRSRKYKVQLVQARICGKWQKVSGSMLWFHPADSSLPVYHYGDEFILKGHPVLPSSPSNPFGFDYRKYLALQGIHLVYFQRAGAYQTAGHKENNRVVSLALAWREKAERILHKWITDPEDFGVIQAMLLGQRDGLSNELKSAFSSAGGMHVLAVSGLHVGILYFIISLFFKKNARSKIHKFVQVVVILSVLWGYALLTGLSPSVMRAAVMFSVVAVGESIRRSGSFFNSLAIAACILLFYNPSFLFMPGFQLSFLAVGGIVWLQPHIDGWINPPNRVVNYFWQLCTVSLAAQLAVTPLSLYYFQQFPLYFLLTNLLIVPASFLLFIIGVFLLSFSFIEPVAVLTAYVLQWLLRSVNWVVKTVEKLPASVMENLYIDELQLFCMYGFLAGVLFFLIRKKLSYLTLGIVFSLGLSFSFLMKNIKQSRQRKVVVYAQNRMSAMEFIQAEESVLLASEPLSKEFQQYTLRPAQTGFGIRTTYFADSVNESLKQKMPFYHQKSEGFELASFAGRSFVIIRKALPRQQLPDLPLKVNYIVLSENSVTDLSLLKCYFSFDKLIIDTSYKKYLAEKLENEAKNLYLSYTNLHKDGALVIDL